MESDGGRHEVGHLGMAGGRFARELRDVLVPVLARQQEVRGDDDHLGTAFDTAIEGGLDGRLGEFHVGRLDDAVVDGLADHRGHLLEHLVRGLAARAVVDDDEADASWVGHLHGGDSSGPERRGPGAL